MLYYERKFKSKGYDFIIGVDEVGRGPLAGPVVAAAVSLKKNRFKNRIDDSKKLTSKARETAFPEIFSKAYIGVGIISEKVIDRLNIEVATRLAMKKAIKGAIGGVKNARRKRIYILVDGNVRLDLAFPYCNIIRGDSKSKSIASASIVAKVVRDRIMSEYDKTFPGYGFIEHKGYPTERHRQALKKLGPSAIHRLSFSYGKG